MNSDLEWSAFLNEWFSRRAELVATDKAQTPTVVAAVAVERLVMCGHAVWDKQRGSSPGLSGILVRHAFECWVLGLYVCLDGAPALRHLLEADAKALRALVTKWPESAWRDELVGHDGRPSRPLVIEVVADRARTLLESRGTKTLNPSAHYQSLYRVESRTSAHAGLASFVAHLDDSEGHLKLSSRRPEGHASDVAHVWILSYAAHLGAEVFEAFGFDRSRLDDMLGACLDLFD